jgi:hypothetical protein
MARQFNAHRPPKPVRVQILHLRNTSRHPRSQVRYVVSAVLEFLHRDGSGGGGMRRVCGVEEAIEGVCAVCVRARALTNPHLSNRRLRRRAVPQVQQQHRLADAGGYARCVVRRLHVVCAVRVSCVRA